MSAPLAYTGSILSPAPPFLATLPLSAASGQPTAPADPKDTMPVPAVPPAHEQKGLPKSHAAGLRSVQDSLGSHNGGIFSGPPIGPPSTNRVITRSATLPTDTGASSGAPVIASTANSAAKQNLGSESRDSSPAQTELTTFENFGMLPVPD
ncbi:hypothetical protein B0H13DRAFT_2359172 [Mycena leptocephala]|nr:hypothetical protein B0H13DRAFT_2359172 [Mycena leptocephala]